jgi:hypothetical protein
MEFIGLPLEFLGLALLIVGYVIGLGAVTVIDMHGFLAQQSPYWTQATIRTHKITKPLIWLGTTLAIIGGVIFYTAQPLVPMMYIHLAAALTLIANGLFLSFVVSPYLLKQEQAERDTELLPISLQRKIIISFLVSVVSWWGSLLVFIYFLTINFII